MTKTGGVTPAAASQVEQVAEADDLTADIARTSRWAWLSARGKSKGSPTAMEGAERVVRADAFAPPSAAVTLASTATAAGGESRQLPTPDSPISFLVGRLAAMFRCRLDSSPVPRRQPAGHEPGEVGRCMGMHTEEMVCLEAYRERRRAGLNRSVRVLEERVMEGTSIAYERCESDRPELATLKACHLGIRESLKDIGSSIAELIKAGVQVPTEMLVAQSEVAEIGARLLRLIEMDIAENRDHRAIIQTLRGDRDA